MLTLMQGSILLKCPVSLFLRVSALSKLVICASHIVVYVTWTQVVIVYAFLSHSFITMFLGWLQIRPCIRSLKDFDHLVPNQRSVCNK